MKVKTVDERIEQFKTVHGDRYDYSLLTNPIKWDSKIPVICSKHGVFETIVNNHHRGVGCPVCAGVKLLSREEKSTGRWRYTGTNMITHCGPIHSP